MIFEEDKNPEESNLPQHILEKIENEKKLGIMIAEIKNDLCSNPVYKDFFDKYDVASVEAFIENYAIKKASYIVFGEMHMVNEEKKFIRYQTEAQERLWEIQRKKLFNLQCQWRAELIQIKEIEISHDFEYWESDIGNCPFLTPISQDEFDLYLDYVMSEDFFDFDLNYTWMGYQDIKDAYNKEHGEMPPWYEYYDLHMGTSSLMALPDIRGEKEKYYIDTWRKMKLSKHKLFNKKNVSTDKTERKPSLPVYDLNVIKDFIQEFENSRILDYFNMYEKEVNESNDDLEQAIKILREADEEIPLEPNCNWREALINAAQKYEQQKLVNALKQVYQKYLTRVNLGIAQETHSSGETLQRVKEWISQIKNEIIQARKALGEPADLNF